MVTFQELDAEIKELASLIPTSVFCTDTQEKYDKMLNIKLTLQNRIKSVKKQLEESFGGNPDQIDMNRRFRAVCIAFNKFVDKQARYEELSDPIARMALIANQSPNKMYKNSVIELFILDGKK